MSTLGLVTEPYAKQTKQEVPLKSPETPKMSPDISTSTSSMAPEIRNEDSSIDEGRQAEMHYHTVHVRSRLRVTDEKKVVSKSPPTEKSQTVVRMNARQKCRKKLPSTTEM